RKAGNVFGIATGRALNLIIHESNYWKIPFDFLICNNGAVLYDEKLNVLRSVNVPDMMIREVLLHPSALASTHYELCNEGISRIYVRSTESIFHNTDIPYERISLEESLLQNNVQQISFGYAAEFEYKKHSDSLLAAFHDYLSLNMNHLVIDINHRGINKLSGILDMLEIQGWPAQGLLAIGDNENDLSMIRHFKGFSINGANRNTMAAAAAVYNSVGDMLRDQIRVF
ncbi:MAG: HAD hydrolase family protein, partial [Bacillota bacterium]